MPLSGLFLDTGRKLNVRIRFKVATPRSRFRRWAAGYQKNTFPLVQDLSPISSTLLRVFASPGISETMI